MTCENFSVAEERFLESLNLVESLPPEDSYTYFLAVLKNLGSYYMQFKKFSLTAPLYEKAYEVATTVSILERERERERERESQS